MTSAGSIFPTCLRARAAAGGGRLLAPSGSGSLSDIFSSIFSGGGRGAAAEEGPEPGSDLEYQVNVPFWTAIRGGVMRLNIARRDVCGNCHGNGFIEAPASARSVMARGRLSRREDG